MLPTIEFAWLCSLLTFSGFSFVFFNQVAFRCVDIKETLQMICTVEDPGLGAYIFHNNKEHAHCVSFPFISCISFTQGNVSVTVSNDTVFTIASREKNSLNGTWTCRNGIGIRNENASIKIVTQCKYTFLLAKFYTLSSGFWNIWQGKTETERLQPLGEYIEYVKTNIPYLQKDTNLFSDRK